MCCVLCGKVVANSRTRAGTSKPEFYPTRLSKLVIACDQKQIEKLTEKMFHLNQVLGKLIQIKGSASVIHPATQLGEPEPQRKANCVALD